MFRNHQPRIQAFATSGPEQLKEVMTFVQLTIQQPLYRAVEDMDDVRARGISSTAVWGFKIDALQYMEENMEIIFETAELLRSCSADPVVQAKELLLYFASLPGFGLAKGGFVVQMAYGLSGCIDSHNLNRFGVQPRDVNAARFKNGSGKLRSKLVDVYHDLVETCGGTEKLWDGWCEYVAENQPERYRNAFHVSELHCDALGLT